MLTECKHLVLCEVHIMVFCITFVHISHWSEYVVSNWTRR